MDIINDPLGRISKQIYWYDRKSRANKNWFYGLKLLEIVVAASLPVIAKYNWPLLIALLGATIVVLESIQGLFKFHENWILYRSTTESLKHEKHLFEAKAGPYEDIKSPEKILAERTEGLVSQEHAKWTTSRSESKRSQ